MKAYKDFIFHIDRSSFHLFTCFSRISFLIKENEYYFLSCLIKNIIINVLLLQIYTTAEIRNKSISFCIRKRIKISFKSFLLNVVNKFPIHLSVNMKKVAWLVLRWKRKAKRLSNCHFEEVICRCWEVLFWNEYLLSEFRKRFPWKFIFY